VINFVSCSLTATRQQGSGSSAGGSGGSHRARLFSGWGGGEGAGEGASEVPHDPGFDDAKRKWGELDEFFTTVYQAYLQATTGIIGTTVALCTASFFHFTRTKKTKTGRFFFSLYFTLPLTIHQPPDVARPLNRLESTVRYGVLPHTLR
jgi:hypothetical protein